MHTRFKRWVWRLLAAAGFLLVAWAGFVAYTRPAFVNGLLATALLCA